MLIRTLGLIHAHPTTWNSADKSADITLTNGDLSARETVATTGAYKLVRATNPRSSGKWVFEITASGLMGGVSTTVGITQAGTSTAPAGSSTTGAVVEIYGSGGILVNGVGSGSTAFGGTNLNAQTGMIAVDLDNKRFWAKGGGGANWNDDALADPATNTGGVSFSGLTAPFYPCLYMDQAGGAATATANFGNTALAGAIPSGFAAWRD